jgi:hypothetical protein
MGNLIVNQCEYGCGVVGHWDLDYQKQVGEELEEHYKNCPIKKRFGDRALKEDYRLLIEEDKKINNKMENKIIPLSEKIITQSEFNYRHQGFHGNPSVYEETDVKQSLNECLKEIKNKFPIKSKEFIQLIEIEDIFKKHFGDLIE